MNSGSSLPPIALTVAATGAAVPSVDEHGRRVRARASTSNAANNTATDTAVVVGPNLSTSTKTVVDLNGGEPEPGDTVRYTITLVESAGVAATGVSVVDDLAAELGALNVVSVPAGAVDASTGAGTGANGTGRVNVTNIAVPANGSATIVFDARIAAGTSADDADRQHGHDREPRRARRGAGVADAARLAVGIAVVGREASVSAQHARGRVVAQPAGSRRCRHGRVRRARGVDVDADAGAAHDAARRQHRRAALAAAQLEHRRQQPQRCK